MTSNNESIYIPPKISDMLVGKFNLNSLKTQNVNNTTKDMNIEEQLRTEYLKSLNHIELLQNEKINLKNALRQANMKILENSNDSSLISTSKIQKPIDKIPINPTSINDYELQIKELYQENKQLKNFIENQANYTAKMQADLKIYQEKAKEIEKIQVINNQLKYEMSQLNKELIEINDKVKDLEAENVRLNDDNTKKSDTISTISSYYNYLVHMLKDFDENHFVKNCFWERFILNTDTATEINDQDCESLCLKAYKYITDLVINIHAMMKQHNSNSNPNLILQNNEIAGKTKIKDEANPVATRAIDTIPNQKEAYVEEVKGKNKANYLKIKGNVVDIDSSNNNIITENTYQQNANDNINYLEGPQEMYNKIQNNNIKSTDSKKSNSPNIPLQNSNETIETSQKTSTPIPSSIQNNINNSNNNNNNNSNNSNNSNNNNINPATTINSLKPASFLSSKVENFLNQYGNGKTSLKFINGNEQNSKKPKNDNGSNNDSDRLYGENSLSQLNQSKDQMYMLNNTQEPINKLEKPKDSQNLIPSIFVSRIEKTDKSHQPSLANLTNPLIQEDNSLNAKIEKNNITRDQGRTTQQQQQQKVDAEKDYPSQVITRGGPIFSPQKQKTNALKNIISQNDTSADGIRAEIGDTTSQMHLNLQRIFEKEQYEFTSDPQKFMPNLIGNHAIPNGNSQFSIKEPYLYGFLNQDKSILDKNGQNSSIRYTLRDDDNISQNDDQNKSNSSNRFKYDQDNSQPPWKIILDDRKGIESEDREITNITISENNQMQMNEATSPKSRSSKMNKSIDNKSFRVSFGRTETLNSKKKTSIGPEYPPKISQTYIMDVPRKKKTPIQQQETMKYLLQSPDSSISPNRTSSKTKNEKDDLKSSGIANFTTAWANNNTADQAYTVSSISNLNPISNNQQLP